MAYDPRSGNNIYSTDDLISLAKLGTFGPKSQAVLVALFDMKRKDQIIKSLSDENDELRKQISKLTILNSEVEEISIDQISVDLTNPDQNTF